MEKIWLKHFGFRFDPFEFVEASADPNLNLYLVRPEAMLVAASETPLFVFSPPGGGKTALRIHTARACWAGAGGYQPFPIHYHLPHYFKTSNFSTLDDHLQKIVHSSANALFLAFLYYPLTFLKAPDPLKKHLVQFIYTWIPEMEYYISMIRDTNEPDHVANALDRSYILYQKPDETLLQLVSTEIEKNISRGEAPPISLSIQKVFEKVISWITQDLGFRSVYILLDGVDGFKELTNSPGFAVDSLLNLFAEAPGWTKSKIFLKGFLPTEIRGQLHDRLKTHFQEFAQVELKWDEALLAEMLRRRIYAAVDGAFASLGAVSNLPISQDIELQIAHEAYPLPREMLVLVNRVLFEYEDRWLKAPDSAKLIQLEDLDQAFAWYKEDSGRIRAALTSIAQGS